jgi:3-hydroxyisobutyrate dehydrogenase
MIGYVGLGNMGGALAERLALSRKVLAFDLNETACQRLAKAGAEIAADLRELADRCDVILLCLPTSQHVEKALKGEGGLAGALRPGTIVVDQTSGDPNITRRLATELAEQGVTLIDAPVSGGPQGAAAGTIAIMVGSDAATFEKVKPIFDAITPNVFHAGEIGAGQVIKLANNLLSGGTRLLSLEAVTLAVKNGVSAETAVNILLASGGANFWLGKYGESLLVRGEIPSSFTLGLIHKDVKLACQMGVDSGMPMFFGSPAKEFYQMAINAYSPDTPVNTIALLMEKVANANFIPKKDEGRA